MKTFNGRSFLFYWLYRGSLFITHYFLMPCLAYVFTALGFFRARLNFERGNGEKWWSQKWDHGPISKTYEVSSEGELEQIRSLIQKDLDEKLSIQLIYCSPSVEQSIEKLKLKYPHQLMILRLPFLDRPHKLTTWIQGHEVIFCRYDLFPHLLQAKFSGSKTFKLYNATLKGAKYSIHFLLRPFFHVMYESFSEIVCATPLDVELFQRYFSIPAEKLRCYDFRQDQIQDRLAKSESTLQNFWGDSWGLLKEWIESFPYENRHVAGSFWETEKGIFQGFPETKHLMMVFPHQVNEDDEEEFLAGFFHYKINRHVLKVRPEILEEIKLKPAPVVIWEKGILCEMYPYFYGCYVGGGFGRSIHSVLEAHLAKCLIRIGPRIHRSTEYDFIMQTAPQSIHIIQRPEDYFISFNESH
jgi:3-deoxy-D-manno-octulosonic-acid transferase